MSREWMRLSESNPVPPNRMVRTFRFRLSRSQAFIMDDGRGFDTPIFGPFGSLFHFSLFSPEIMNAESYQDLAHSTTG
jgi:hypothetical protein